MRVYLIRHAQTHDNKDGITQSPESGIIEDDSINWNQYSHLSPEIVFVSPFLRAQQSAQRLFPTCELVTMDYIHELIPPRIVVGMPYEEKMAFWAQHMNDLRSDENWSYDGGESFAQIKARAKKFLSFLQTLPNREVAVVSHGNFLHNLIGVFKYGDIYSWQEYENILRPSKWENLQMKKIEW